MELGRHDAIRFGDVAFQLLLAPVRRSLESPDLPADVIDVEQAFHVLQLRLNGPLVHERSHLARGCNGNLPGLQGADGIVAPRNEPLVPVQRLALQQVHGIQQAEHAFERVVATPIPAPARWIAALETADDPRPALVAPGGVVLDGAQDALELVLHPAGHAGDCELFRALEPFLVALVGFRNVVDKVVIIVQIVASEAGFLVEPRRIETETLSDQSLRKALDRLAQAPHRREDLLHQVPLDVRRQGPAAPRNFVRVASPLRRRLGRIFFAVYFQRLGDDVGDVIPAGRRLLFLIIIFATWTCGRALPSG